jgi:host factor-I protein
VSAIDPAAMIATLGPRVWGHVGPDQEKRRQSPMSDKKQNLQDTFLNSVRKTKTPLTIFLVNGVKLQGVVSWFDNFCVLLRRDGQSQLVYKHAISTIMPAHPVQLYEPGEEDGDD